MKVEDGRIIRMLMKFAQIWNQNRHLSFGEMIWALQPTWLLDPRLTEIKDHEWERAMDQWIERLGLSSKSVD